MRGMMKRYIKSLADLLFPRECAVCGRHLLYNEEHLCIYCLNDLPLTYSWDMKINIFSEKVNALLGQRLDEWEPFTYATALFYYSYDNQYHELTKEVKYRANLSLGAYIGRLLGERLKESEFFRDVDLVVPVPLHWTRRLKRGYNQSESLVKGISQVTGWRKDYKILVRSRRTKSQTMLSIGEKMANVSGAFAVDMRHLRRLRFKPHHILIIDDVFTTGATMINCQRALRQVFGPEVRISIATAAGVQRN